MMCTMITPIFFFIFSFSKLLEYLGNVWRRIAKLEKGSRVVPQGREEDLNIGFVCFVLNIKGLMFLKIFMKI